MSPTSSAPEEHARPATDTDLPAIVALAEALRRQMADQRGGPLWAAHDALVRPTPETLSRRLTDPELVTLVGTLDGHVLAYGFAHTEIVPGIGLLGVIDELFVAEPARAVGLGETLLGALVARCVAAECVGIDATALPGDRLAKNFFESAGFKARRLVMHKTLD
jgi:Acetyltransferase (GNAT) family.